jgi:bifunctional DNase/RNase
MYEARIKSISVTDIGFVVFIKREVTPADDRVLPIFIGPVEAQAISTILLKQPPKRPMTHDLFAAVLHATEWAVVEVAITELKSETFFATLTLQPRRNSEKGDDKGLRVLDARPSDAIALALRHEAPLKVDENLWEEHAVDIPVEESHGHNLDTDGAGINKKVNEQLGIYRKMLDEAVKEERFEEAEKIRKQIEALISHDN